MKFAANVADEVVGSADVLFTNVAPTNEESGSKLDEFVPVWIKTDLSTHKRGVLIKQTKNSKTRTIVRLARVVQRNLFLEGKLNTTKTKDYCMLRVGQTCKQSNQNRIRLTE